MREERKRLCLNQTDFAALAGVQISAQTNYENDKRQPDAKYLAAIAAAGADVSYILTGVRAASLTPREAALLDNYRHCPEDAQRNLEKTSALLAKLEDEKMKDAG